MQSNSITGIYLVYLRWGLIWFENKVLNKSFTVKDYELIALLLSHFDKDYVDKILESINKYEKVIIDFDKNLVKKVIEKDMPFIDSMKKYFNVKTLESRFDLDSRTIIPFDE